MAGVKRISGLIAFVICVNTAAWDKCCAQDSAYMVHYFDSVKTRAFAILSKVDTTARSIYWPSVDPQLFFSNLRRNIRYPAKFNQGKSTNFCSYAALTHLLITYQPDNYVRMILALYFNGNAGLNKRTIKPSKRVREAAGTLSRKGELDILHADQLWLLTMADTFKGYLNLFDHKYDEGNENTFWAATNYKKFNKMLREFGKYKVEAAGSDLIRPWKKDLYGYTQRQLEKGLVMLYINSTLMHPTKHSFFLLPAPTHFVVLYEIKKTDGMIEIKYWDYGLKTVQLITPKRFRKTIFGISTITQ